MSSVIYYCADPMATWNSIFYMMKKQNLFNCGAIYVSVLQEIIRKTQSKCMHHSAHHLYTHKLLVVTNHNVLSIYFFA